MFGAFIGGWELVLLAVIFGAMVSLVLITLAIVFFIVNRRKAVSPSVSNHQGSGTTGGQI